MLKCADDVSYQFCHHFIFMFNQAEPKYTATMVHKLITTLVREDEPELVEPLVQQLSHSSKTGADNYQLKMKQKFSAKMVKVMASSVMASSVEAAARTSN